VRLQDREQKNCRVAVNLSYSVMDTLQSLARQDNHDG
jgi:hypothetical protein